MTTGNAHEVTSVATVVPVSVNSSGGAAEAGWACRTPAASVASHELALGLWIGRGNALG